MCGFEAVVLSFCRFLGGSASVAPDATAAPPVPPPIYERLQLLSDGGSKQPQVIALGLANGETAESRGGLAARVLYVSDATLSALAGPSVILLLLFRRIGGLKFGEGMTADQILKSDREIGPLLLLLSYLPALLAWLFKPLLCYALFFFAVRTRCKHTRSFARPHGSIKPDFSACFGLSHIVVREESRPGSGPVPRKWHSTETHSVPACECNVLEKKRLWARKTALYCALSTVQIVVSCSLK